MALPAIIGIPALAAFIGEMVVSLFTRAWSVKLITISMVAALAGTIYLGMVTLNNAANAAIVDALRGMPPEASALGYLLPSNLVTCINISISVQVACTAYALINKVVLMKVRAIS